MPSPTTAPAAIRPPRAPSSLPTNQREAWLRDAIERVLVFAMIGQYLHPRSAFDGNGLGLAICKRIVQIHDGEISVESIEGEGSVFSVCPPGRANTGGPMSGIERIMLVDDNEADNVYHEIILRSAGYEGELWIHESGEAALAQLKRTTILPPCLVLLDINMPGMSGFEFATAAAPLLSKHPTLVVVMLTSSSSMEDRKRAATMAVISSFLTKPLTVRAAHTLLSGGASQGVH